MNWINQLVYKISIDIKLAVSLIYAENDRLAPKINISAS